MYPRPVARAERARRFLAVVPLALGLAAAAGCRHKTDETSLLVVVTAPDLQAGVELDQVLAEVTLAKTTTMTFPIAAAKGFPVQFGVVPASGATDTVWIKATGRLGAQVVVTAGAHVGFVHGETRVLTLVLRKACAGVACSDVKSSCGAAGTCALSPEVAVTSLPKLDGGGGAGTGGGAGMDGGAGTGGGGMSGGAGAMADAAVDSASEAAAGASGAGGVPATDGGADAAPEVPIKLAENGQPCQQGGDCVSTFCVDSVCCTKPADQCAGCFACNVGGKGECAAVPNAQDPHKACPAGGSTCNGAGMCTALPPSCSDSVMNGTETDKNCGGLACPKCGAGLRCLAVGDCQSGVCSVGKICVGTTCEDGAKSPNEADLDCGGACTKKCAVGAACGAAADCTSVACNLTTKKCVATHCEDGATNAGETDVDCGGTCTAKCETNRACAANTDCASNVCSKGKVCVASRCVDGFQNGDETDVDCGGATCAVRCGSGSNCLGNGDCGSSACSVANKCVGSACFNGRKDADETDLDCGGVCSAKCAQGKKCSAAGDCAAGRACVDGVCCGAGSCPACQRCDLNGAGTCSAEPGGTAEPACATTCGTGACGNNGACAPASPSTQCGGFTCTNGAEQVGQWTAAIYRNKVCSGTSVGSGACVDNPTTLSCNNYACASGTSCRTNCTKHSECVSGFHCENNQCVAAKGVGASCSEGLECLSRVCGFNNTCVPCYSRNSCPTGTAACEDLQGGTNYKCLNCLTYRGGFGSDCLTDGTDDCRAWGCFTPRATDCNQSTGHCGCGSGAPCAVGMFCMSGVCKVGALQPCVTNNCAYGSCNSTGLCGQSPEGGGLCTGDYSFLECVNANSCSGVFCH